MLTNAQLSTTDCNKATVVHNTKSFNEFVFDFIT